MATSIVIKVLLLASIVSTAIGQDCTVATDLAFLLDSSGSIRNFYAKEKAFLNNIASSFTVGPRDTRLGVVTFSYFSELSIKFNQYPDLGDFQDAVKKIPLMGQTTYMDRALRLAEREMFTVANGARPMAARLIVLLTDGKQTTTEKYEKPGDIVKQMRLKGGINVIVVGMGPGIKTKQVVEIAGGEKYAFKTNGFAKLANADFLKTIKLAVCDAAHESLGFEFLTSTSPPQVVCPDYDTDYTGKDVKLDLNVVSWTECGYKCKQNPKCKYFTFVQATGCCYHKGEKGTVKNPSDGLISGSKTCPVLRCNGIDSGCCTSGSPCIEGDGNCNADSDCATGLFCGKNNCPWGGNDNCCKPKVIPSGLRCAGADSGCCTKATPCGDGDGDCDVDTDCAAGLICGQDNCPWGDNDDCCVTGKPVLPAGVTSI